MAREKEKLVFRHRRFAVQEEKKKILPLPKEGEKKAFSHTKSVGQLPSAHNRKYYLRAAPFPLDFFLRGGPCNSYENRGINKEKFCLTSWHR